MDRYLDAAHAIARRLCADALWSGARCNWLGDAMEYVDRDWRVVHRACGTTLYDGTSGIGLFLARVAAETGDDVVRATARGALEQCVSRMHDLPASGRLGVYSGWTGIATALIESGRSLGEERWIEAGQTLLSSLTVDSDDGEALDVISGPAGAIPALLATGDPAARELAIALGDRLATRARSSGDALSWETLPGLPPLTGYSHGASGIAVALHELYVATGEPSWAEMAARALAWERRHYVASEENWPDLRSSTPGAPPSCACAWCHGAPGIALARLRLLGSDARLGEELAAAMRSTRRGIDNALKMPRYDCTYCHGLAGLAEVFVEAGGEENLAVAREVADAMLERVARVGAPWPCGVPNGGETPALMTGVAGVGWFMLRVWGAGRGRRWWWRGAWRWGEGWAAPSLSEPSTCDRLPKNEDRRCDRPYQTILPLSALGYQARLRDASQRGPHRIDRRLRLLGFRERRHRRSRSLQPSLHRAR